MRIQAESWGVYRKAHRKGIRSVRKMSRQGANPYLLSLDSFLSDDTITERVNLGVMDIPTEKIVGVQPRISRNCIPIIFFRFQIRIPIFPPSGVSCTGIISVTRV